MKFGYSIIPCDNNRDHNTNSNNLANKVAYDRAELYGPRIRTRLVTWTGRYASFHVQST